MADSIPKSLTSLGLTRDELSRIRSAGRLAREFVGLDARAMAQVAAITAALDDRFLLHAIPATSAPSPSLSAASDQLLTRAQAAQMLSLTGPALDHAVKRGAAPAPVDPDAAERRWRLSDIRAQLDALPARARLLREEEVVAMLSIGRSTLWRLSKQGALPGPVYPAPGSARWRLQDIEDYLSAITARRAERAAA